MLTEESQRKTNSTWFHSFVEFKKQNKKKKKKRDKQGNRLLNTENTLVVARGEVGGRINDIKGIKNTFVDEHW